MFIFHIFLVNRQIKEKITEIGQDLIASRSCFNNVNKIKIHIPNGYLIATI